LRYLIRLILNTFYLIIASEGRSQGKQSEEHTKVVVSLKTNNQHSLAKVKIWLSRRINLHRSQGWCRSGAPKIATHAKSVDLEKEKKSSYRL
jgi:hypothetical protein